MKSDNELIAEFMGFPVEYESLRFTNRELETKKRRLQYDTSWDWLMPVVEKIASMNNQSVTIGSGQRYVRGLNSCDAYCRFENWKGELISESAEQETLIRAAYKSVIEFIHWYNSHQAQNKMV